MSTEHGPGRRWLRIVPVAFVTYSLAYFDRVNCGFGTAAGLAADLHLSAGQLSLLSSLFFLGYLAFQIPGTIYAERRSVKDLIFWCTLAWGLLASLTGVVTSFSALLIVRFLLGVAEAAVMPAMLVYLSLWFTRSERSRANTFLILGNPVTVVWMSIVSGYLVQAFNWRWMFIIEGLPAVLWALYWRACVAPRPAEARWMSTEDAQALAAALLREQAAIKPVRDYRAALTSGVVLYLSLQYFCWSLGIYGFVLWLPSILRKASAYGMVGTGWLSAGPFLVAVPAMLLTSHASDRALARTRFIWPFLFLASAAFLGAYLAGDGHFWLSYALLIAAAIGLYAPYGPFFAMMPERLPRNVAGGATAMINSLGALGGFIGTYLVGYFNSVTGSPGSSYLLMSAALLASALLLAFFPEKSAN